MGVGGGEGAVRLADAGEVGDSMITRAAAGRCAESGRFGVRGGLIAAGVVGVAVLALSAGRDGSHGGAGGQWGIGVASAAAASHSVLIESQEERAGTVIVVRGRGEDSEKPDRATAVFGAQSQAATASDAQRMVNQTVNTALESIRQLGIRGLLLQTSQLSLYPVFEQVSPGRMGDREPRIVGYRAVITVSARIDDIGELGRLIDTALQAGANRLDSVSFGLSDDSGSRRRAITSAVMDASRKAEAIAMAMGLRLGEAIEVIEDGATVIQPMREMNRMQMGVAMSMDLGTPIETGEVGTVAGVTIRYRAVKP